MSSSSVIGTPGLTWTVCVLNWCYIDFGEGTGPDKKGRNVQLCIGHLYPETYSQDKGVSGHRERSLSVLCIMNSSFHNKLF